MLEQADVNPETVFAIAGHIGEKMMLSVAMATTRRLAELESRVNSLESALSLLESALVLLDASGQVVLANDAARAILGQGKELYLRRSQLISDSVNVSTQLKTLVASCVSASVYSSQAPILISAYRAITGQSAFMPTIANRLIWCG